MNLYIVSLGCAKNRTDAESVIGAFELAGHRLVFDEAEADVVVIMSCAFIEAACKETEEVISEFIGKKRRYGFKVLVGGCYVSRFADEAKERFPQVDGWFGISGFNDLPSILDSTAVFTSEVPTLYEESHSRRLTTPSHWAWLKIADGCNHRCAFCMIPSIRGGYRSRKLENIVREAQELAESGVRELNLIAQDTGLYGHDIYGSVKLVELLRQLEQIDKIGRIRLLYINPQSVSDELISHIKGSTKTAHYLDIPLQHASDAVLKRMNRPGRYESYMQLLKKLKSQIPDITVRSTFIVGFPGETDADFELLKQFLQEAEINRAGFFKYSDEDGSRSFQYTDKLSQNIIEKRFSEITRLQTTIASKLSSQMQGNITTVIVDSERRPGLLPIIKNEFKNRNLIKNIKYIGRTPQDAPDVDGVCYIASPNELNLNAGDFVKLKIVETTPWDVAGYVVE